MKYLVTWTEYHSAVIEAENRFEADANVHGKFDADTTFDSYDARNVIGEDEDQGEDITELTVESKAGMTRHYSRLLYDACMEFVRKVEEGTAVSKRSYKEMKHALDLIHNRTERT